MIPTLILGIISGIAFHCDRLVPQPQSSLSLLENLKAIYDVDLLHRSGAFDRQDIADWVGGPIETEWLDANGHVYGVHMGALRASVGLKTTSSLPYDRLRATAGISKLSNGVSSAYLNIFVEGGLRGPSYSEVVAVFGPPAPKPLEMPAVGVHGPLRSTFSIIYGVPGLIARGPQRDARGREIKVTFDTVTHAMTDFFIQEND